MIILFLSTLRKLRLKNSLLKFKIKRVTKFLGLHHRRKKYEKIFYMKQS